MKALSVRQPWTELIARGTKTLEIRTWTTRYRGPVLILACAAPSRTPDAKTAASKFEFGALDLGVSVCVVDLVDVRPVTVAADDERACCPVIAGEFAWVLRDPRRVHPAAVKGRLGLFVPDAALQAAISAPIV